jgi:SNF2 family DNA or RNA helicase
MLRRTKNQEINGEPIIKLPSRRVEVINCDFDEDERAFYDTVEARANKSVDKLVESGQATNSLGMLILLLRLRQGMSLFGASELSKLLD